MPIEPIDQLLLTLQTMWGAVAVFIPKFIVAVVIFLVGWIIAVALGKVVAQIVRALKVDQALSSVGAEQTLSRAGFRLDTGEFLGALVRWFFIIVFLIAAVDVFELVAISEFLRGVALYIPSIIVAAVILVAAALIAAALARLVQGSAQAAHLPSAAFLGGVTKWAVWVFGILAALDQLQIAPALVDTLFMGIIAMVAISGGIAFGLGGKDHANRFLERLRKDISE